MTHYVTKSFYKTASLMANSCKSAAIMGGHGEREQELGYEDGKSLGLAFQVISSLQIKLTLLMIES